MSVLADQRLLLRRSLRGWWPHLPVLTVSSVAVCLGAGVTALVSPGLTPVSVLALIVLVLPPATGIGAVSNTVVGYDDASIHGWWRGLGIGARCTAAVGGPLAVAGCLLLVAIEMWHRTGQPVLLASIGVSGAVTAVLIPLTAAMLQITTGLARLPRAAQWRLAATFVARWPVRFVAAPVLLCLGLWVGTQVSVSLLLLVPAPVALVNAAAFWTSAVEGGYLSLERD